MSNSDGSVAAKFRSHLEGLGANLVVDDAFVRLYSVDFTLTRLRDVHAHVNLGVHVTTARDSVEELGKFLQASKRGVVMKSLYVEISEDAEETGGVPVAFGACLSVLFDRRFSQHKAVGVRIHEDCSFQFFEVEDALNRLERKFIDDDLVIGDTLVGKIIAYFTDKGFGFIQTEDERKFFFHIANVVDDDLRARLPAYVLGEVIPVDFQFGGNDGKKYPKAINVALNDEFFDEDYDSDGYRD